MPARTWLNLALLAAALALGLALALAPQEAPPPEYRLSPLEASQVDRVHIARASLPPMELKRAEQGWRVIAPVDARAAPVKVERMLELLAARSRERLEATGLERYDLAPPPLTVTLGGQSFGFGLVNPVTGQQYVLAADGVYLVSPRYAAAFPLAVEEVLARELLAPGEQPVAIELPGLRVALQDGRWQVESAIEGVSQDEVNRWVDRWRHALAVASEVAEEAAPAGERALIRLADGRTVELAIESRTPQLVLLRRDEGLRLRFSPEVSRAMLAPPGSSS
ncbi:DUF4340 domain-containing protein [Pelomicrobium sp. G1]|uniref:DUF4340 domain-containing protein n=1 Tax=unclassified Pelomicrobium TaxID=2815318 RepID=UPI003F7766F5